MALEFERIGNQTCQQPMGMMVDSYILRPEQRKSAPEGWVLNPSFQRGSVWTPAQKVAWIETILRGLALPSIFVNRFPDEHPKYGWSEIVIDGQQRLRATAEFMRSEFKVRGEYYKDQDVPFQRFWKMGIGLAPIVYCNYKTEKECAELYLKLLTAGTAHTTEEIEKARKFIEACDD